MLLIRLLMLVNVLACESRMVIHVTVCAIQSSVLGSPSIKTKNLLGPLHVRLLMLRFEIVVLWNWAFWIAWTVRIEEAVICIEISIELPSLLDLDGQLDWLELTDFSWNKLEAPRVLDHVEVSLPSSHVHASLEVLDANL